ncbi:hypothetical protein IEQ34_002488 [Dendrobium chrysotoxum]|uniref:Uncharacterized protein n=1 Tax=Dendrobium chrysotoxum TaxID=161865 RepID=A0AAV7HJU9_DENCH|nr:hypothetical protein IEQ34_002488 [Dendrobium chrysotoxum]
MAFSIFQNSFFQVGFIKHPVEEIIFIKKIHKIFKTHVSILYLIVFLIRHILTYVYNIKFYNKDMMGNLISSKNQIQITWVMPLIKDTFILLKIMIIYL